MHTNPLIALLFLTVLAYFLGSIPFALLIGKAHGVDIRTTGSRNIGATNLGRTIGLRFFFYAFILDALKGFLPTLAAALLIRHLFTSVPDYAALLTGAAAFTGHLAPIYLKFKGGKGVATGFGVVLGLWPLYTLAALGALVVFLVVFFGWRYISLASIMGSLGFVALVAFLGTQHPPRPFPDTYTPWSELWPLLVVAGVFSLLLILKHRGNITRLLAGTEPKFGQKKPPTP